mmetsp:Transcript_39654/g.40254  ORF Transcript_39654/g.40254 Transcript_39654/m.40254 type:complete len:82 (-) Transcript_39654:123-368(-)
MVTLTKEAHSFGPNCVSFAVHFFVVSSGQSKLSKQVSFLLIIKDIMLFSCLLLTYMWYYISKLDNPIKEVVTVRAKLLRRC